ncbi:MAG: ABC transporter permease [candidate division FCPU426 bacterium]
MASLRPLGQLLLLQWRSFFREPGVLFWALVFPLVLSGLLGLAYSHRKPAPLPILLLAENPGQREALESMVKALAPPSRLKVSVASPEEAALALKRGKAVLSVDHALDPEARRYRVDANNPEGELALLFSRAWFSGKPLPEDTLPLDTRGSRYIDFLLPGLMAFSIINSCLWGVAWVLIDYRQKKFMRRMVATPMSRGQFFMALFIGRCCLVTIETCTLLAFGFIAFHFSLQGDPLAFALVMLAGVIAFFGLGALISCRTSNSQVGAGLINATTLPMMLISGIFFSYERFPEAAQPYLRMFPPTMMVDALRAVANEGAGVARVLPTALALSVMGLLCMAAARRFFRWY